MAVIITTTIATPQHPQQPHPIPSPTPSPLVRSAPLFDPYEDPVGVARPVAVAKGTPLDAVEAGLKVPLGATSDISVGRGVSKRKGEREGRGNLQGKLSPVWTAATADTNCDAAFSGTVERNPIRGGSRDG